MSSKKIIFLADSLSHARGAEKTLINYSETIGPDLDTIFINTEDLSPAHICAYKDCKWVVGNFYRLIQKGLLGHFVESIKDYYVVNFDYLFCRCRNIEYHKHLNGTDLQYDYYVRVVDEFLSGAKILFFMSLVQKDKHLKYLNLIDPDRCVVLGSLISPSDLKHIKSHWNSPKNDLYCIYPQDTWQKGLEDSIKFCEDHEIAYEILPKLDYGDFIKKFSTYKGLVFLPRGGDTAPRITIEAKLLGLDLEINPNVEHQNEDWFNKGRSEIISYMAALKDRFVHSINEN